MVPGGGEIGHRLSQHPHSIQKPSEQLVPFVPQDP